MQNLKAVDIFSLTPEGFERLCADIVRSCGMHNVRLQGKNCPAFDILANEVVKLSFTEAWIKWGIQCKLERRSIGPDVFDNAIAEASKRKVKSILVVSPSGFTDRTIQLAEKMEENPQLVRIDFWNDYEIRRYLAIYPDLIQKYFDVDIKTIVKDIKSQDSLVEMLSTVSGALLTGMEDLTTKRDLDNLVLSKGKTSLFGGTELPAAQIMARYRHETPRHFIGPSSTKSLEAYDEFIEIEHHTTISAFLPEFGAVGETYKKLTDAVRSRVRLNKPDAFGFTFARHQKDWNVSHLVQHNEYTWLLGENTPDLRKLESHIQVKEMFVNGIRLRCIERKVSADKILVVMAAKSLKKLWGKEVEITYTIENIYGKDHRSLLSSLHAPTRLYRFSLTCPEGFNTKPKVNFLLGGIETMPDIKYHPDIDPVTITVQARGDIPRQAGIVINW